MNGRTQVIAAALTLAAPLLMAAQAADSGSGVKLSGYVTASYFYAANPTGTAIVGRLDDRFYDAFIANAARITFER